MLLGVLLYAYRTGVRSSRQIERRCHVDIAFRVLAAKRNRTVEELRTRITAEVERMLEQARQIDQREDEQQAIAGNQTLPAEFTSRGGRLARPRAAKARFAWTPRPPNASSPTRRG